MKEFANTFFSRHSPDDRNGDEISLGGAIELDSVDWGAVARCYKLLRLRSDSRKQIAQNEKLSADFERWISLRMETVEFDIALRMLFDEIVSVPQQQTSTGDAPVAESETTLRRFAAMCRERANPTD